MKGIQDAMEQERMEEEQWMDRAEWRLGIGRCQ
jgi:hypothetical protein